ncbi:MAG: hypothetical protein ACRC0M_06500 [Legionella sp.]
MILLTGPGQLTWNNGLLTFISNGQAMGDLHISLATIDDTIVEGTEQFSLSLSNPGSGTGAHVIGSGSVTTSIIDNDIPHFAGSGDSVLLSTVGTAVLPNFQGAYGLSLLNPVQGDLTGLINTLIGPGGILQGETFENALAIVLSQQGVLFNTDAVQLTDSGSSGTYQYQMAFNGSENFINYQNVAPSTLFGALSVTDQLSLLGYSLDGLHDLGNGNLLFTTTGGGNLPYYNQSTGSYTTLHFSNEDVILAVKQPGGFYTYQKFFDGSSDANLDDSLLNLPGVLRDFSIDGLAYSGSLQNGTMYFSLSNLVDVNIAPLLGLDVMGALFDNGGNVYSIQKVNGVWDKSSIAVFFNAAQFGWTNELLENALIDLAQLHVGSALASAINALIGSGQVANYFNIDALDIDGNTMYFSVSSLLSVDLINLLRQVITNPLDPLYALTLRGENIYTISRENASSAWNLATLSLYLDGSNYGLGSSSGLLGNISDNLIEDVNAFSLVRGDHSQPTIMFTTAGGGNESQLGGYNAGTIVQVNNGTFYKAFDLAAVTNNMVTNNSITGFDVLENGTLLLVLGKTATLPGCLIANPNDVIAWNGHTFSMQFDGSAHGLPDGSIIESLYVFPSTSANSGKLLMSVDTTASLPGVGHVANQDIIMFNPQTNSYQMILAGSTVGINDVGAQIVINADLSAGINSEINGLFSPLVGAVTSQLQTAATSLQTTIIAIDNALHNTNLVGSLLQVLSPVLGLVGNLLTGVNSLLTTLGLGLDALDNVAGSVANLSTELHNLLTNLNGISGLNVTLLALQGISIANVKTLTNNAIAFVDNTLSKIAAGADVITHGVDNLIHSLETQLAIGTSVNLSLYDIKIDALHQLSNGDYLISFAQQLRPELDLHLTTDTSFLNNAAVLNLNLGVNTTNILNALAANLDGLLDPILGNYLISDLLASAISPDLGLIGSNIYRLSQGASGDYQFSLYFDGADHGLDNGSAADTVLDYINSLYGNLTLAQLLDQGILHLSSNEDINSIDVNEQSSHLFKGSVINDLLVGHENANDTFYGGLGNDVMTGNGGANSYQFDKASVNIQHVEQDVITDFNPNNGDKLIFLSDIFNGGTNPLENQVHTNLVTINGVTSTLVSVTQPGSTTVIHEVLLIDYAPPIAPLITDIAHLG